jgi:hypothetical protein
MIKRAFKISSIAKNRVDTCGSTIDIIKHLKGEDAMQTVENNAEKDLCDLDPSMDRHYKRGI